MTRTRERTWPREGHFPLLVIRNRGPLSLPGIIRMARNTDEFLDLLKDLFTTRSILRISTRTQLQSRNPFWYLYRRCVITGTIVKRVMLQNMKDTPDPRLNRIISKYFPNNFKNEAMVYGIENERKALDIFFKIFEKRHSNARSHNPGITFYDKAPYIAGSPDAVFSCDCCTEDHLVEVKCPFRLKDVGIGGWKILEYLDPSQMLRVSHTYNHQINLYQGILGLKSASLIVYAKGEIIEIPLKFDQVFFETMINHLSQYYLKHYLPSVIGKRI